MSTDVTQVLIDMLKETKGEIKEIKEDLSAIRCKQEDAAVAISVVETMQRAIESLKTEERLKKVEITLGQSRGGLSFLQWLIPTVISIVALGLTIIRG